jgi:hypothetical protein
MYDTGSLEQVWNAANPTTERTWLADNLDRLYETD